MSINNAIASVAVKDLARAKRWYEALLGRAPDSTPMEEVAEWKFRDGGWLQVYQLPERAGNCSFTLAVTDFADVVDHVTNLGIDTTEQSSGPQVKTLMIADPDGNHIAFSEVLDKSMAH